MELLGVLAVESAVVLPGFGRDLQISGRTCRGIGSNGRLCRSKRASGFPRTRGASKWVQKFTQSWRNTCFASSVPPSLKGSCCWPPARRKDRSTREACVCYRSARISRVCPGLHPGSVAPTVRLQPRGPATAELVFWACCAGQGEAPLPRDEERVQNAVRQHCPRACARAPVHLHFAA